jgi:hypothetical protein
VTDKLHTPADVAARWHKTEKWVANQLRADRFPHVRIGNKRFMKDEDIAAAEQIMRTVPRTAVAKPIIVDAGIGSSMSPRSRRRMAAS